MESEQKNFAPRAYLDTLADHIQDIVLEDTRATGICEGCCRSGDTGVEISASRGIDGKSNPEYFTNRQKVMVELWKLLAKKETELVAYFEKEAQDIDDTSLSYDIGRMDAYNDAAAAAKKIMKEVV